MSIEQILYSGAPGEPPYNQALPDAPPAVDQPERVHPELGDEPVVQRGGNILWEKAIPIIALGAVVVVAAGALIDQALSKHTDDSKLVPVTLTHSTQLPVRFAAMPPSSLPKPVEKEYDSVLKVQFGESNGSGVKVAPNLAWTGGSLVTPRGPGHPTESICDDDADVDGVNSTSGYGGNITNWYSQYNPASFPNHPDFSLLQVQDDPSFAGLPAAPIARTTPTRGELAYFINYEATDNGTPRYPNADASYYLTGSVEGTAAEYPGVVLGYDNGLYMVATDLGSYGPAGDLQTNSAPAMKGGPVFSPTGILEGISVSYRNDRATVEQVANDTGVELDEADTEAVDISFVQPVSHSLLAHAKAQLGAAPNCN